MNNTDDDRLTTAASRLATEISPQRDLWPGIEEAIARPKRSRWTPMFAQAAAVVLLVGASSMVTYFVVKEDQRVVEVLQPTLLTETASFAGRASLGAELVRARSHVGRWPPHRLLPIHAAARPLLVSGGPGPSRRGACHAVRRGPIGGSIMIVATAPFIAGHRVVETKGQTFGLVVRSRGFSGNLIAGLRSLGGGEIHETSCTRQRASACFMCARRPPLSPSCMAAIRRKDGAAALRMWPLLSAWVKPASWQGR